MEVNELSPEELKPFKEVVGELQAYLKDKYGAEACAAFGLEQEETA